MLVRCVVSCRDASGSPTFFPVKVNLHEDRYALGDHYEAAGAACEELDYEEVGLVYDENDGPAWLFEHFDWNKVQTEEVWDG
jgi:hypothetical protein